MHSLESWIRDQITSAGGRIPFSQFMASALYHPEWGYYNRPEMTIGETGDFFTSPMVHPIFGQCVARQILEIWHQMSDPSSFAVVEMGAGTGALARDILNSWIDEPIQAKITYHIVEQSPTLQSMQQQTLQEAGHSNVVWYSKLEEIPGYGNLVGIVISNELFDALPIHRIVYHSGRFLERYVVLDEGQFTCKTDSLSDQSLTQMIDPETTRQLLDGDLLDVCPSAGDTIRSMGNLLEKGVVMTIDYGDMQPDVYFEHVSHGGLRCYFKQTLKHDPFHYIGQQDMTADVDFTYLQRQGSSVGLSTVGYTNQTGFLAGLGFLDVVADLQKRSLVDLNADFELQRILTLFLPQGLGNACKVLIQSKGMELQSLSGLRRNW